MIKQAVNFFQQHKWLSALAILLIVVGAYFGYKSLNSRASQTGYVLGAVTKDTVISSISGSGQVSSLNQFDLKPKVSSEVTAVLVKNGQTVKAGTIIARLDAQEAIKSLRDAQISYESAKLSLEKARRGSRPEDLVSSQLQVDNATNNIANAEKNLQTVQSKADSDLSSVYADTKNTLQDAYDKADDILNRQLDEIYSDHTVFGKLTFITSNQQAEVDANSQRLSALTALSNFKNLMGNYPTNNNDVDTAISNATNYLNTIQNFLAKLNEAVNAGIVSNSMSQSTLNNYKSSMSSARSSINSSITSLENQRQAILTQKSNNEDNFTSAQNSITSAQNSLKQAVNSLTVLKSGTDPLDLKGQEISLQQSANQVNNASQALSDYVIKASFDGIVADVTLKKGDSVSAGTVVASLLAPQKIAEISLNEVDAAKVKIGQKASLTFDAIEDLEITGKVIDIDTLGTVSQGVVTYNAKISFDTQDDRIKSGMSASAIIITEVKQNVLVVPNGAIKSQGDSKYVLQIDESVVTASSSQGVIISGSPLQTSVTIGLADDNNTQIISGLSEGDSVVIKTNTIAAKTSAEAPSLLQSLMPQRNRTSNNGSSSNSNNSRTSGSGSGNFIPPHLD